MRPTFMAKTGSAMPALRRHNEPSKKNMRRPPRYCWRLPKIRTTIHLLANGRTMERAG